MGALPLIFSLSCGGVEAWHHIGILTCTGVCLISVDEEAMDFAILPRTRSPLGASRAYAVQ